MDYLIFALVVAAALVLVFGPLFGHLPAEPAESEEQAAPPPSDRSALLEDIATGKLRASDLEEEEAQ